MTINVGDLVMVVRAHCVTSKALGRIYVVRRVEFGPSLCSACGREAVTKLALGDITEEGLIAVPLPNLIKIDPQQEPEHIERDEEITA